MKMVPALTTILAAASLAILAPSTVHAKTSFKVVTTPHPNPNGFQNILDAVSGSSPTDIWAVGECAMHYDGKKWRAFPAPELNGYGINELVGVADISPDNVWAVG
jgi:hypothetical protein